MSVLNVKALALSAVVGAVALAGGMVPASAFTLAAPAADAPAVHVPVEKAYYYYRGVRYPYYHGGRYYHYRAPYYRGGVRYYRYY